MMTVQASKTAIDVDEINPDASIFDPRAFRLNDEQAAIIASARELGQRMFAGRAAAYDRDAKFPTETYRARHRHPQKTWRPRRRLPDLCLGRR
jgi:hypothetical protein